MNQIEDLDVVLICAIYTASLIIGICIYFIIKDWLQDRRDRQRRRGWRS
jgi:peptidoglycan/LPS O-acetylase OafA/YrhL